MELYTLRHSTHHFTDFIPKLATALFQCALSNPGGLLPVNSEAGSPMTASVEPCKSASGIQVLTCLFFSCWIVSLACVLSLISFFSFCETWLFSHRTRAGLSSCFWASQISTYSCRMASPLFVAVVGSKLCACGNLEMTQATSWKPWGVCGIKWYKMTKAVWWIFWADCFCTDFKLLCLFSPFGETEVSALWRLTPGTAPVTIEKCSRKKTRGSNDQKLLSCLGNVS